MIITARAKAVRAERHRIQQILSWQMQGINSLCVHLAFETNYSVEQSAVMVNRALRALRGVDQKAAAFVARVTEPNPCSQRVPPTGDEPDIASTSAPPVPTKGSPK